MVDISDSKTSVDKIGRREGDSDYSHRRHHRYPYYPYYWPYRYYGYGYGYDFYRGYYPYSRYFYGPYGDFYFPHYGYGYDYGYRGYRDGGGGGGGASYGDGLGGLDLNVKPKDAIVYVNGDQIGPVDRYDGYPSYLWLEPGTYNISFYLEGYETLTVQHTVYSDVIIAIKERLTPGVATVPEGDLLIEAPEIPEDDVQASPGDSVGRLLLTVRPPDAAVYLDGHFLGIAGELAQLSAGLLVEPGSHVLELVRPGYHTEEIPVTVPPGEQLVIDRELQKR